MTVSTGDAISAIGSVSFGWLHEQGGFQFDESFFLDPHVRLERERQIDIFVAGRFPEDPVYNMEAHLPQIEFRREPVALVGAIQPNLILGAAVGAQFVFYGDKDPDITPAPLAQVRDVDPLWRVDWLNTWPICSLLEQVQMMQAEWSGQAVIVPPFFWDTSGRATIHGVVTTAQKLLGERLFTDIVDDLGFVRELFRWIVQSYIRLIELCADAARMEITGLHFGDCSLCMISPRFFDELVLPCVSDLTQRFGPLRLHSCGHSDHLLKSFHRVRQLASLNVGSNTSVAGIRELFPSLPIDLVPDTQLLTDGSADQVDAWVRECIKDNRDGPLQFQYHLDAGQPVANCLQIHRTLRSLGIPSQRETIQQPPA